MAQFVLGVLAGVLLLSALVFAILGPKNECKERWNVSNCAAAWAPVIWTDNGDYAGYKRVF